MLAATRLTLRFALSFFDNLKKVYVDYQCMYAELAVRQSVSPTNFDLPCYHPPHFPYLYDGSKDGKGV